MPWYEALVTCAYLVALTKTCRVGTAVLILPQRNVLELAKSVATIDKLSGGRMMLGVGLGWLAEETEALGYSFSTRATRADEMIHVLRDCWSGRTSGFNGSQLTIPAGLVFSPTPAQPGGPPILVGGVSPAALRRAGMVGDGWLGRGQPTGLDVSAMRTSIAHVKKHRYDSGRAGSPYNVMMVAPPGAERGSLETLISQTAQSGFDEFLFEPRWDDLDDAAAAIRAARSCVDRQTKLPEPSPDAIGNPRR
jgi:probable F420-dependent oxidoreductase